MFVYLYINMPRDTGYSSRPHLAVSCTALDRYVNISFSVTYVSGQGRIKVELDKDQTKIILKNL